MPENLIDGSPVDYPKVTIGGRVYVVKFGLLAEYMVSKWKLDLKELTSVLFPKRDGEGKPIASTDPANLSYVMQLWAACTAHNFTQAIPPQAALTAEEWMAALPEDDLDLIKEIAKAVGIAVVKRLSDRMKKAAPTPTVEPPAAQLTQ